MYTRISHKAGIGKANAVAGTLVITMAYLTMCLIGFANARAENAINGTKNLSASGVIACGRDHLHRAFGVSSVGGHSTHPLPIDGKIVAGIPIWRTIILGTHDSANALLETLKAAHCPVGDLAGEALERPDFTINNTRTSVNLTVLSVADLGFGPAGASRAEIYRRAVQLGFGLCPVEVAPQLRLQYADQPLGESLHIATKPISTVSGDVVGLNVGNGGAGLFLVAVNARPEVIVPSNARFVFIHDPRAQMQTTAVAARRTKRE